MKHILSKTNDCELTNVQEGDSQPNAVDLRINKIFEINKKEPFIISEETKTHRGSVEVQPDEEGWFNLERFTILFPTFSANSDKDIFLFARITSRLVIMVI